MLHLYLNFLKMCFKRITHLSEIIFMFHILITIDFSHTKRLGQKLKCTTHSVHLYSVKTTEMLLRNLWCGVD